MPHSHKFKLKIITSEDVRRHYNGYKEKKSYEELEEVYFIVERALELAFKGDFVLKFYPYLEGEGVKKKQIEEFIESSTAAELSQQVFRT